MSDVVIVGGGIAGSSLAILLARGGVDVTVLERTTAYEDRVRGETMPPWGYRELVLTGLLDVFLRAEGVVAQRYAGYGDTEDPDVAHATAFDASSVLPGTPGSLNLSHPGACPPRPRRQRRRERRCCVASAGSRWRWVSGRRSRTAPRPGRRHFDHAWWWARMGAVPSCASRSEQS